MEDHLKGTEEGGERSHPNHSGSYVLGGELLDLKEVRRLLNRAKRQLWNLSRKVKFRKNLSRFDQDLLVLLRERDATHPKK